MIDYQHPCITYTLTLLKYTNRNIERIFFEYDRGVCKVLLHPYKGTLGNFSMIEKPLSLEKFTEILNGLTLMNFRIGIEENSLYSMDHRKILYIRLILPDCLLSLDFEDEKANISISELVEKKLRDQIKIVK